MAYNDSKLCNVLFAKWLQRQLDSRGHGKVLCVSLHPGTMFWSNIQNSRWYLKALYAVLRPFTKSLAQAAATSVFAATAPELEGRGGAYLSNCFVDRINKVAEDETLQDRVMEMSVGMVDGVLGAGSCQFFH